MEKNKVNVVLLPTENKSKLCKHVNNNDFAPIQDYPYPSYSGGIFQNYHLYLTSSEEIKRGDWYYNNSMKVIGQRGKDNAVNDFSGYGHMKKVIVSTDKSLGLPLISDDDLVIYIKSYNYGIIIIEWKVEMEYPKEPSFEFGESMHTKSIVFDSWLKNKDKLFLKTTAENNVIIL